MKTPPPEQETEIASLKAQLEKLQQQSSKTQEPPETKALNSFKTIVAYLSGLTNTGGNAEFTDFAFNVNKTDSLVSPFTGYITFQAPRSLTNDYTLVITCQCAQQEGKWLHKEVVVKVRFMNVEGKVVSLGKDELSTWSEPEKFRDLEFWKVRVDKSLSKFLGCPILYQ